MKFLSGFSNRQKAIAATIILVLILLAITLLSLLSFSSTQAKLEKVTTQYQPKMLSAMQLTTHFYHSLSVLGNYLIEKDEYNMTLYRQKVADIDQTLRELVELTEQNPELDDSEQLGRVRMLVDQIIEHNVLMLELAQNNNKNMPAIGIASDRLEPLAVSLNQIINDLLVSTEEYEQPEILLLVDNLRFNWTQVVSEVRNYLAFRNEEAIEEITLYNIGVDQSIAAFDEYLEQMDPDQTDLLDEVQSYVQTYRDYLNQAISIHAGNEWRADRQLMRKSITPTLRTLTKELEILVTKQQRRIKQSNEELSDQINSAEHTIRIAIQIALVITLVVVFLSLRNQLLIKDIRAHKESERRMRYKAHHDSLTGLANRALFEEKLFDLFLDQEEADIRAQDEGKTKAEEFFGLLYIDLDGFKAVNDNVGHDAGDFILTEASKRMVKMVRTADLVARLGGDEFAILLHGVTQQSVLEKVASNLCEAISEDYVFNGQTLNVSASIGLTFSNHPKLPAFEEIKDGMDAIIKQADEAMYEAKKSGKNQYKRFS